jgi:acyl dehydratase
MTVERFPVEASHILMFARAIRDPNPMYSDPEYAATTEAGAVVAPPTFVQASAQFDPDYWLRPRLDVPWFGSGREATGLVRPPGSGSSGGGTGGLHAEQHFEYHRPVRAGDVLTATVRPGSAWQKEGRRGGTLSFTESITEYRTLDGELVVTARSVSVKTGQVVEQEG